MRRALVGIVPQEVLTRKSKQVSSRIFSIGLQESWESISRAFKPSLSSRCGYIDQVHFFAALHDAKNGRRVHLSRLFKTISFEFWLRDMVARHLLDDSGTSASDKRGSTRATA